MAGILGNTPTASKSGGGILYKAKLERMKTEDTAEATRRSKMGTSKNMTSETVTSLKPKNNILQLSQGAQQAMANAPASAPKADPSIERFMTIQQAKQSGKQPIDIRTVTKPASQEALKSNVTQFAAGLAESTIPRAISSMQKLSTGTAPLVDRLKEESKPYSNAARIAGTIAGELATQPLTYGTIGKAASGASVLQKIGSPFLRNVIGGQLADTVIQTPGVIIEGIANKRSAGEILGDVGKQQAMDLAGNVLFAGAESLIKGIANKLKAGKALTQVEIEEVKKTPELLALPEAKQYLMLPEAKQYLMLPEGKITTPDVIEALPPKPTLDDLDVLKRKPSNAPMNKNYPNLESMDAADLKALSSELATNKENLINEQIKWLKETSGKGVEQGKLFRGSEGEVVGRQGRISKNEKWYQDWARENGYRKIRVGEYREIAEKQLREGFNTNNGYVPPNEDFLYLDGFEKNVDIELASPTRHSDALNKAKQYLEAKNNLAYNVPEQFRRETPFTVAKSTVPPKVDGKYAKETFDPLGGKLPKTESKPKRTVKDYINDIVTTPADSDGVRKMSDGRYVNIIKQSDGTWTVSITDYPDGTKTSFSSVVYEQGGFATEDDAIADAAVYATKTQQFPSAQGNNPLGGKLPKAEPTPLGGKLPKAEPDFTPIGGKRAADTPQGRIYGEPLPEPAAKVNLNTKKQGKPLNLYTKIVDSQNPIVKMSKETGDKTATLASNSRNVGGTVDYILKDGLVDRQGNKIGESLREVAQKIPKAKEQSFWDYMMQRGNIDRAREGKAIISNYTPEMSMEAVRLAEAANPEFKAIGDNITDWIDKFMKEWGVKAGTVDETLYGQLRETYKSYVPTQREFSELEKAIPGGVSRKFVDQTTPIRKATGSDRNIKNPIENIMGLVNRTVRTAKYNEVGQELLKTVRANPEKMAKFAEVIPAADGMFANVDNIVTVLEGGKPVYLRINDRALLEALEGLPKAINNLPGMRKVTGIFKSLITQKNPLFAVRNVARDIPTAYVYGSTANPIRFVKDYVGALKDIATDSPRYQRYRAIGGGMSNFFKQGDTLADDLVKNKNIFQKISSGVENVNNMLETAPRLAEFNRTLERTGDIDKALFAANDVTVNFARGGNLTKSAEPLIPYVNAGVQGLDKLFRTIKDPKKFAKMLVKGGISITTPTIALYMMNRENPHYQELGNRTKDNYFLIPSADKDENGYSKTFIKIPKSRELGVLFGALFERALRAAEGEKEAWKGFAKTAASNIAPANPIENNFFSPILNLKSNKDFAGRSIVPQGMIMDKRSPYLQYDERTSEIAKKIGELTKDINGGLSPKQIDYLVKSYTGVIGQLGIPAATKGGDPLNVIATQFTSDPLYSSQTLTDFYDNYDKLQRAATDKNITEQLPTSGKENVITKEEVLRNEFAKASEQISDINKQIRQIEALSVPDKQARIRELRQEIQDIAKKTNSILTDESYKADLYKIAIMKAPSTLTHNKQEVELTFEQRKKYADLVAKYKKELLKSAPASYKERQQEWDELIERKAREAAAKQIKIDIFRK